MTKHFWKFYKINFIYLFFENQFQYEINLYRIMGEKNREVKEIDNRTYYRLIFIKIE